MFLQILQIAGGISYSRPAKKAPDSLYVMANHGQLLEYSLDPVPDPSNYLAAHLGKYLIFLLQRYQGTRSVSQVPLNLILWLLVSGILENQREKTSKSQFSFC